MALASARILSGAAGRLAQALGAASAPPRGLLRAAEAAQEAAEALTGPSSAQRSGTVGAELQVIVDLLESRRRAAIEKVARSDGDEPQHSNEVADITQELEAARRCLEASLDDGCDTERSTAGSRSALAELSVATDSLLDGISAILGGHDGGRDASLEEEMFAARRDLKLLQRAIRGGGSRDGDRRAGNGQTNARPGGARAQLNSGKRLWPSRGGFSSMRGALNAWSESPSTPDWDRRSRGGPLMGNAGFGCAGSRDVALQAPVGLSHAGLHQGCSWNGDPAAAHFTAAGGAGGGGYVADLQAKAWQGGGQPIFSHRDFMPASADTRGISMLSPLPSSDALKTYVVSRARAEAETALLEIEARLQSAGVGPAALQWPVAQLSSPVPAHPVLQLSSPALPHPPRPLSSSPWLSSAVDASPSAPSRIFSGLGRRWVDDTGGAEGVGQDISFGELADWFPDGTDLVYDSPGVLTLQRGSDNRSRDHMSSAVADTDVFPPGECDGAALFAGRVLSSGYDLVSLAGSQVALAGGGVKCFCIEVELVGVMSEAAAVVSVCLALPVWSGRRRLQDMPIRPLCDPDERSMLMERGRRYVSLASGHHHVQYGVNSFLPGVPIGRAGEQGMAATRQRRHRAGGRIMLDQRAYSDYAAERMPMGRGCGQGSDVQGAEWSFVVEVVQAVCEADMVDRARRAARASALGEGSDEVLLVVRAGWRLHEVISIQSLDPSLGSGREGWSHEVLGALQGGRREMLWQTAPAIWGYSFQAKKWGWAVTSGIDDVTWTPGALEGLILPHGHKEVLTAMMVPATSGVFLLCS